VTVVLEKIRKISKRFLRPHNMGLVDFLICGTQKGGTSALDAYLREHPEICMADRKEVHFFDNEKFFSGKTPKYSAYHRMFDSRPSHKLIGEATPSYMYWYEAPRRIWEYNPNMKLIVILRNPIERAYSHWNMQRTRNIEHLTFWEAIQSERERCRQALPYQHRIYSYVDRGFYLEQLRRIWTYFPKKNILIIRNEDLRSRPHATLQQVSSFLQVDPFRDLEVKDVHSRAYASATTDKERDYLRHVFEYEIRGIERVLGWDCGHWLR
jgi:hypothetical protein